jgi:hypothetical protein
MIAPFATYVSTMAPAAEAPRVALDSLILAGPKGQQE